VLVPVVRDDLRGVREHPIRQALAELVADRFGSPRVTAAEVEDGPTPLAPTAQESPHMLGEVPRMESPLGREIDTPVPQDEAVPVGLEDLLPSTIHAVEGKAP
jgi:hypothetical protein